MLKFSNGHEFEFCVASGALAYDGNGWWFEQPWRWLGILRPQEFTIITKTLTYLPRKGNLKWWCPWRCVRLIPNGVVNSVGLTNPGIEWWINTIYPKIQQKQYNMIVSIAPEDEKQANRMVDALNACQDIVGIELNVSCPNVEHDDGADYICMMADLVSRRSNHPVILKLSYDQPYLDICKRLENHVEAFDCINAVPWRTVFPKKESPLSPYKLVGGVSGHVIKNHARLVLSQLVEANIRTPIISGGGVDSLEEVQIRQDLGADAVSFGTVFMRKPWLPNQIISRYK